MEIERKALEKDKNEVWNDLGVKEPSFKIRS